MAATAVETMCEPGGWNDTKAHPPWDEDELLELAESLEPSRSQPIGCNHPGTQFDRVELEEDHNYTDGDKKTSGNNKALPFWSFDPDEAPAPKGWLIKDVAAKGETAGWIGPPGSGKSAVVLDWFMHSAMGRDWRGHKCKQQAASVYFAFERANLTRRRIKAYAQRWGLKTVPIAVVSRMLDLMDPATVPVILETIKSVEDLRDAGRIDRVRHMAERHRSRRRRRELGEGRQQGSSQPAPNPRRAELTHSRHWPHR